MRRALEKKEADHLVRDTTTRQNAQEAVSYTHLLDERLGIKGSLAFSRVGKRLSAAEPEREIHKFQWPGQQYYMYLAQTGRFPPL